MPAYPNNTLEAALDRLLADYRRHTAAEAAWRAEGVHQSRAADVILETAAEDLPDVEREYERHRAA